MASLWPQVEKMGAEQRLALSHTAKSCRFKIKAVFGKSTLDFRISPCRASNCIATASHVEGHMRWHAL
jgi:hypothetical protein